MNVKREHFTGPGCLLGVPPASCACQPFRGFAPSPSHEQGCRLYREPEDFSPRPMNVKRYTLVIKGTPEEAVDAAHWHLAIDPEPAPRNATPYTDSVLYAWMDEEAVMAWFTSPAKVEPGIGYHSGTLLWYQEHEHQEEWEGDPAADVRAAVDSRLVQSAPRDSEEVYSLLCLETLRRPIIAFQDDLHFHDLRWLRKHPGQAFIWILRDYGTYIVDPRELATPSMLAWLLNETKEPCRTIFYVDPNAEQCVTRLFESTGPWPIPRTEYVPRWQETEPAAPRGWTSVEA